MAAVHFYTYRALVICCHRVPLTDRWLVYCTLLSLHLLMVPDMKSIYYEIKFICANFSRIQMLTTLRCRHIAAGLSSWNNYRSHNSPFIRRDDTPSSSLCHVQSPCSSRPQIGCLSNAECVDKWLHPVDLPDAENAASFPWRRGTTHALKNRMIGVYTCDIHPIHSLWLCLHPEVTAAAGSLKPSGALSNAITVTCYYAVINTMQIKFG